MKTANNYDEWIKVKSKKEIRALNPKNNDLVWYAELCPHHKTHPSECTRHQPITLKEFFKRRNRKQRKKIKKVYYHRNLAAPVGFWANMQLRTQQNVAVIANFLVVLAIVGYMWFNVRLHHASSLPKASHHPAQVDALKKTQAEKIAKEDLKP